MSIIRDYKGVLIPVRTVVICVGVNIGLYQVKVGILADISSDSPAYFDPTAWKRVVKVT